ncbi:MAG: ABC transporter ATP-binding protein [Planctomycetota bacterium]
MAPQPEAEEATQPAESAKRSKERVAWPQATQLFRRLWPELRPELRPAIWAAALALVGIPTSVASPFLTKYLFDDVLPNGDVSGILRVGGAMVGLTLVGGLLGYVQARIAIGIRARVRHRLTWRLFSHVLHLPLRYFHGTETGYLMSRIRDDVNGLDAIMVDALLRAVVDILRAAVFLGLLFFVDVGLALSGALLLGIILGLVFAVSPALRRRSEVARETDAKSSASLHEAIAGLTSIRTAAREGAERRRFLGSVRGALRARVDRDVLGALTSTTFSLVASLGLYVILAVGAYRIAEGESSIGGLMAFLMFLMQLMSAAGSVFGLVPAIQQSLAALQRLFRLFDEDIEPSGSGRAAGELRGAWRFRGVSFRYEEDGPWALREIDFEVQPGELIALVGRSGSGKTTLVHLLPRLFTPQEGRIELDGRGLNELSLAWLRSQIGVVPQDVFLFDRTVRENLAYSKPDASELEIVEAARKAHALEFVERLPKGMDTRIGERGVRLSGGEKQRLAIARELLRDPPVLIFDEATANLDAESEALLRDAMEQLRRGRTCFVIAHRLSTIRAADRILVLNEGRLVESGSHRELLAKGGIYSELHALQFDETPQPSKSHSPRAADGEASPS